MPLEKFQFEAEELMHDLNSKIEDGMICKKSNKEPTGNEFYTWIVLWFFKIFVSSRTTTLHTFHS